MSFNINNKNVRNFRAPRRLSRILRTNVRQIKNLLETFYPIGIGSKFNKNIKLVYTENSPVRSWYRPFFCDEQKESKLPTFQERSCSGC